MTKTIIARIPHPLREPTSPDESRTYILYKDLRRTFDKIAREDRYKKLKRALSLGEIVGCIFHRGEGYCYVSLRCPDSTQKQYRDTGDLDYAHGLITKPMKGLVDLIDRFDVELAYKEAEIADLKAQVIEEHSNFDNLLDFTSAVARDSGVDFVAEAIEIGDEQVVRLVHSVRERIWQDRVHTLNERIAELEARLVEARAGHLETLRQMGDVADKLVVLYDRMDTLEQGNNDGEPRTA
jgi:hypothetical protein